MPKGRKQSKRSIGPVNKMGGTPGRSSKKMPGRMRSSMDAGADTFKPSKSASVEFGGGFDGKARKGGVV